MLFFCFEFAVVMVVVIFSSGTIISFVKTAAAGVADIAAPSATLLAVAVSFAVVVVMVAVAVVVLIFCFVLHHFS